MPCHDEQDGKKLGGIEHVICPSLLLLESWKSDSFPKHACIAEQAFYILA